MYRFAMGGELLWGQCFAAGVAEERQMSKIKCEGFLLVLCGCVSSLGAPRLICSRQKLLLKRCCARRARSPGPG